MDLFLKKIKKFTPALAVLAFVVGVSTEVSSATPPKKKTSTSAFSKFKSSVSSGTKKAASGTKTLFGKAKTGTANKFFACGTDCANGKQSVQALASCAFTHPRVPKCMRGTEKRLSELKKLNSADYQDEYANLDRLMETYFELTPLSQEILLQMAKSRVKNETDAGYKSKNLFLLKRFYTKVFKPTFFMPDSEAYESMMAKLKEHKVKYAYVGYIFHVDSGRVKGERMAYGLILHSPEEKPSSKPDSQPPFKTGLVFQVPFKTVKMQTESPVGEFFYFRNVQSKSRLNFAYKLKSKLGTKTYKIPVNGAVSSLILLDDKPLPETDEPPRNLRYSKLPPKPIALKRSSSAPALLETAAPALPKRSDESRMSVSTGSEVKQKTRNRRRRMFKSES